MSELRNKLIRLAKENPELRKDLLPLLGKEAASPLRFDLRSFQTSLIKELSNFHKMNEKQRKQWKDAYVALLTLFNITFDKDHKSKIEAMLGDMKSELLTKLNADKKALEDDMAFIGKMKANTLQEAMSEVAQSMKSKRGKNTAMYYLKNR